MRKYAIPKYCAVTRYKVWYWDVVHAENPEETCVKVFSGGDENPIAYFPFSGEGYEAADRLIADLEAGRITEKQLKNNNNFRRG